MKRFDTELAVGLFVIAGIVCLGYLSIRLGKMEVFGGGGYDLYAVFSNVGQLKVGAPVEIAGVEVGRVKEVALSDYQARVVMNLQRAVKIQDDAIASIKTEGLIGEKYVEITPGSDERLVAPGGRIRETQPAVDLSDLLSKYVFGKI